jgi:phenylpropionate dioxygenase-like ring-hydroxylating dioxygenase large terminal subunit
LNGKLTKAPRFTPESVPTFDPSTIRLFPIHVHLDSNGFVYVNLDASPEREISWHAQYGQLDRQERLVNSGIDWDAVEYDFTWTKDGAFNWKVMQDNYNEVKYRPLSRLLSPYSPTPRLLLWSASLRTSRD